MATLLLGIRFVVMFMVMFAVMYVVVRVALALFTDEKPKKRPVRNYKVRFDAYKKKYYITNEMATRDVDVTNWLGKRVLYKNRPEADFIVQKLNEV